MSVSWRSGGTRTLNWAKIGRYPRSAYSRESGLSHDWQLREVLCQHERGHDDRTHRKMQRGTPQSLPVAFRSFSPLVRLLVLRLVDRGYDAGYELVQIILTADCRDRRASEGRVNVAGKGGRNIGMPQAVLSEIYASTCMGNAREGGQVESL